MPKTLHADSYEQAFAFGELMVKLFYIPEWIWLECPDPSGSIPDTIDTQFGSLCDLAGELRRVLRSHDRYLCDNLVQQGRVALADYRDDWGSPEHLEAVIACQNAVPEAKFDVEQRVLGHAPVVSPSWQTLRELTVTFRNKLPHPLRDIATLNELLWKVFLRSHTDPDATDRNQASERSFITVNLNRRLKTVLSSLRDHFPICGTTTCNLEKLSVPQAHQMVQKFQRQVLEMLREHVAKKGLCEGNVHLKPSESKAYWAYQVAMQKMPNSQITCDQDVWDWLKENGPADYDLPRFDSWSRYLRSARAKNRPRNEESGPTGRSIVSYEQAHTSRQDRDG